MHRWLFAGGTLLVLAAACRTKSYSAPSDGSDDSGVGDDGSVCTCAVTGALVIPCFESVCTGGESYVCTGSATVLPVGPCGPSDAAVAEEGDCVTTCTGKTCNVSDGCGGVCGCAAGVQCNPNGTCGNGCDLGAGEVCLVDGGSSTTCCASGYFCLAQDAGGDVCCVVLGGDGRCTQDTDCCDYAAGVRCTVATGTCG